MRITACVAIVTLVLIGACGGGQTSLSVGGPETMDAAIVRVDGREEGWLHVNKSDRSLRGAFGHWSISRGTHALTITDRSGKTWTTRFGDGAYVTASVEGDSILLVVEKY